MTVIKATAHWNELTKDVKNDLYLKPQVTATLYDEDINRRLEAKQIATHNVNGLAFVRLFLDECMLAILEGNNVVTSLFHGSTSVRGTVYIHQLGHHIPSDQLNTSIHFIQSAEARKAIQASSVFVAEQPALVGPVIQSVTNPLTNIPDILNTGAMALVQGMRIAVKGDRTDETGLTFTPADGGESVYIPAKQLSPNTPTKLQFTLPQTITPGEWTVEVATQAAAASGKFTKDVRRYKYPNSITVE